MAKNKILIPEAREGLNKLRQQVMDHDPEIDVKYEVAQDLNIPLTTGDNGDLTAKDAGKVGGKIGGTMVRNLVQIAQQRLSEK